LFGNTAACSTRPVANTRCRAPDPVEALAVRGRDQRPAEHPNAGVPSMILAPAASASAASPATSLPTSARSSRTIVEAPAFPPRPPPPGPPAGADHQDVGVQVVHLARLVVRVLRRLAETGLRADEGLDRLPRPPRPVEDLVVEARRHHEGEVFSQPWTSWSTLGHAFWRSTRIPSRTGSVHERTFGIPSTCIRQFGHAPSCRTGRARGGT
jgi:hypothetical protein